MAFLSFILRRKRLLTVLLLLVFQLYFLAYYVISRYNQFLLIRHSMASLISKEGESNLEEKCQVYFQNLLEFDNHWGFEVLSNKKNPIKNMLSHLRVYDACFLQNNVKIKDFKELENKLFPFTTRNLPTYQHINGDTLDESFPGAKNGFNHHKGESFWRYHMDNMNSRGIVISLGPSSYPDAINLIKVLRFHQNTLPIQFFHKGDIPKEVKGKIFKAATTDFKFGDGIINDFHQDVTMVNLSKVVSPEYFSKFLSFSNKWLAILFTSFKEVIMMDCDVIPFLKPEEYFKLQPYLNNNAVFYKDRELPDKVPPPFLQFYKDILASSLERKAFHTNRVTPEFLNTNRFFRDSAKHQMESGLVIMDRSRHLIGLIIALNMQFWRLTSRPVYGDKELWWLGQVVAGNSNFTFNPNSAAAIGTVQYHEASGNSSVCSIQLGHLNAENKLMWINGGLKNCKKKTWKDDFNKQASLRKQYKTDEEVKKYFQQPIKIEGAIIPPPVVETNSPLNKWGQKVYRGFFNKNVKLGCNGYYYCATLNDKVEPTSENSKLVKFSKDEIEYFNRIIEVWNAPYTEEF